MIDSSLCAQHPRLFLCASVTGYSFDLGLQMACSQLYYVVSVATYWQLGPHKILLVVPVLTRGGHCWKRWLLVASFIGAGEPGKYPGKLVLYHHLWGFHKSAGCTISCNFPKVSQFVQRPELINKFVIDGHENILITDRLTTLVITSRYLTCFADPLEHVQRLFPIIWDNHQWSVLTLTLQIHVYPFEI